MHWIFEDSWQGYIAILVKNEKEVVGKIIPEEDGFWKLEILAEGEASSISNEPFALMKRLQDYTRMRIKESKA